MTGQILERAARNFDFLQNVVDGILEPLELAHLPYKKGKTFEDYVGVRGLERLGKKKWRKAVADVIQRLKAALEVDYVVVGSGNAARLEELPPDTRICPNTNAFRGGYRLWEDNRAKIVDGGDQPKTEALP